MRDRVAMALLWASGLVAPAWVALAAILLLAGVLAPWGTAGGAPPAPRWGEAVLGTGLLVALAIGTAAPLGVATAVWLEEFGRGSRATRWIRTFVHGMAGVPGLAYGLGGSVLLLGPTGAAVPAAGLTLGALVLPAVVSRTEAALRAVPRARREAAVALGADRDAVVARVVLPAARSGILSGVVYAVVRTAGEAAPLLVLGASLSPTARSELAALPHHLLALAASTDVVVVRQVHLVALVMLVLAVASRLAAARVRERLGLAW